MGAQCKDVVCVPFQFTNVLAIVLPDLDLAIFAPAEEDLARGGSSHGIARGRVCGEILPPRFFSQKRCAQSAYTPPRCPSKVRTQWPDKSHNLMVLSSDALHRKGPKEHTACT
jgi:hypothetical protein